MFHCMRGFSTQQKMYFLINAHRKNEERKCAERKRAMSMVVSVPLSKVSLPQEELLCSLPLSVFTHSSATCASSLHNRLCHSEALKGLPIATVLEVSVYHSTCLTSGWQDVGADTRKRLHSDIYNYLCNNFNVLIIINGS